ncbi:mechanosensitive ion channel family protein [Marivita sp. GX14005]|uniref:mechanosensitive ion channel family protein n=1 Tax=Marivita sp. GX14005 TaxID=2942276 RepID=UPI002018D812|nr:mechanosensitive ion channel family protein [Marivita sp. GX14005]MCL3880922.1 mechanosensitive ion channel family protein [Marivita sp. GX14005]
MEPALDDVHPLRILYDQIETLARDTIALLPNLIAAIGIILLTALVAYGLVRLTRGILRRSKRRPSLVSAVVTLVKIVVWTFGLMIALTVLFPNLTPTKLLAGLGLGSIAVGLAFKDVFENFLAGFLILLRKPMRIGDDIECNGLSGQVEQITIRDTFLRKRSGELILVPNSFIYKNPVRVLTDRDLRRIEVVVGVAYGEDVDRSREVIEGAVNGLETVSADKPVQVFATTFNSSSIDFMVRWWAKSTPLGEHQSRDTVVAAIKRALDDAGIEIPFPYRTLTFKEPLRVDQGEAEG